MIVNLQPTKASYSVVKRSTLHLGIGRKFLARGGIHRDVGTRESLKGSIRYAKSIQCRDVGGIARFHSARGTSLKDPSGSHCYAASGVKGRTGVRGKEFPPRNSLLPSTHDVWGFALTIGIRKCSVFGLYRLSARDFWFRRSILTGLKHGVSRAASIGTKSFRPNLGDSVRGCPRSDRRMPDVVGLSVKALSALEPRKGSASQDIARCHSRRKVAYSREFSVTVLVW